MNKQQFTNYIADNFEFSQDIAEAIINIFAESIYLAMSEGHKIDIDNFGTFYTIIMPSRKTIVPKIGKEVTIKEHRRPYFKPCIDLKLICN